MSGMPITRITSNRQLHIRRRVMLSTVIAQEIVIEAPLELVWGVVTEPEQISQWFTDATELDLRPRASRRGCGWSRPN
jgi:uncharacterized protein YndB with AHSA1/START domain